MSAIRFKHVFASLLVLSALSAFAIPEKYTTAVQPQVQGLFYPVARPVGALAGWFHQRLADRPVKDGRNTQALLEEIDRLQGELVAVERERDELRRREGTLGLLGESLAARCTLFSVVGADAGSRNALLLRGSSLEGVRHGQNVIFPGGIVGRIERSPGILGAQVVLITDKSMRIEAFCKPSTRDSSGGKDGPPPTIPPFIVEGTGDGAMRVATMLTMEEVKNALVKEGDMVYLEDDDGWDASIQRRRLGQIVRIEPQATSRLHAEIRIKPTSYLPGLREVMVITK